MRSKCIHVNLRDGAGKWGGVAGVRDRERTLADPKEVGKVTTPPNFPLMLEKLKEKINEIEKMKGKETKK